PDSSKALEVPPSYLSKWLTEWGNDQIRHRRHAKCPHCWVSFTDRRRVQRYQTLAICCHQFLQIDEHLRIIDRPNLGPPPTHRTADVIYIDTNPNIARMSLENVIRTLDERYGPITHFYEASTYSTYQGLFHSSGYGGSQSASGNSEDPSVAELARTQLDGILTSVLTVFDVMRSRRGGGKICIMRPRLPGGLDITPPSSLLNTLIIDFAAALRQLIASNFDYAYSKKVQVSCIQTGGLADYDKKTWGAPILSESGTVRERPGSREEEGGPTEGDYGRLAGYVKEAVESGDGGFFEWSSDPRLAGAIAHGVKALNPICEDWLRRCQWGWGSKVYARPVGQDRHSYVPVQYDSTRFDTKGDDVDDNVKVWSEETLTV
ncbi:hypothetical protein CVT26_002392, partial [Gymnopilus dilepis]